MEGNELITYKQICCTCLSRNRKNLKLTLITDGINVLNYLLFQDREANTDTFTKDVVKLYVCWECRAVIRKINNFKRQVCQAQERLAMLSNDLITIESLGSSLSELGIYSENTTHIENSEGNLEYRCDILEPKLELHKAEVKSENTLNLITKPIDVINTRNTKSKLNTIPFIANEKKKEFYTIIQACRKEIQDEKREKMLHLKDKGIVCDVCVQKFKDNKSLRRHIENTHTEVRKTPFVKNPGSKPRMYPAMKDKVTASGFACLECNEYFLTKRLRYYHIQKRHRSGFKCEVCYKVFSFKANLKKHQLVHTRVDQDRESCSKCGKSICVKMMGDHMEKHRQNSYKFECTPCGKKYKSKATYDHHMKYTKAHATRDICKYKCDHCGKSYKTKVDVTDHILYTHMGKTQHACPICKKPVPTKKSIIRHIKTWHFSNNMGHVKKEMCQICGQMFGCKKILREHILRHTGERPLSCEICGNTFRQKASLYTHKKLVHKILFSQKKNISLLS